MNLKKNKCIWFISRKNNLIKYFISYHKFKNKKLFKNGLVKDIIISTNIDWDYKSLKDEIGIEEKSKDNILNITCMKKQSVCYKF